MTRFRIIRTVAFDDWFENLRSELAQAIISRRIARIAKGNLGDVKSVGESVSEIRIDHGPGYRVYFTRRSDVLIVLLCGGDKDSQTRDIAKAKALSREIR